MCGRRARLRPPAPRAAASRDAPRHRAPVETGRTLHLDDVSERSSITVEDVREPRDPVLPVFGREHELLDLPRREAPDRDPLRAQSHLVVVEDDGLAVAGLAKVELDRVDPDALGPVEALDRVLAGAARRAAVADDPRGVGLAPVARTIGPGPVGHETDLISASSDSSAASGSGAAPRRGRRAGQRRSPLPGRRAASPGLRARAR